MAMKRFSVREPASSREEHAKSGAKIAPGLPAIVGELNVQISGGLNAGNE